MPRIVPIWVVRSHRRAHGQITIRARRSPDLRSVRLHQFDTVPEGIVCVEASVAWDLPIGIGVESSLLKASSKRIEVIGQQRRMTSRDGDVLLDPAVELLLTAHEPHAASIRQRIWFGDLPHAEDCTVERGIGRHSMFFWCSCRSGTRCSAPFLLEATYERIFKSV
jgi:hypothetical protein